MGNKIVVVEDANSQEKGVVYSLIAVILVMGILVALGYGVWWLLSKTLPLLGAAYLGIAVLVELMMLKMKPEYSQHPKTARAIIQQSADTMVEKSKDKEAQITQEEAWKSAYHTYIAVLVWMFVHYVITTLLILSFGQKSTVYWINVGAFGLVIWLTLQLLKFARDAFKILRNLDDALQSRGKAAFWFGTFMGKVRNLAIIIFVLAVIAESFGIM